MTRTDASRPIAAVAGIAFDADGRVLLVRRGQAPSQSLWSVPGGRIELGETAAEATVREMAEETGLDVEVLGLVEAVDWIDRAADGTVLAHYVILDHLVAVRGGELAAGDDASEARWFAPEELAGLGITRGLGEVLDVARALAGLASGPPVR
jgi:ADP-ribose pyrophosphatase YjhB (NUDIX family)